MHTNLHRLLALPSRRSLRIRLLNIGIAGICLLAIATATRASDAWDLIAPSLKSTAKQGSTHVLRIHRDSLDDWDPDTLGTIDLPGQESLKIAKVAHVRHESGNRTFVGKIHIGDREYTSVFTYGDAGIVGEVRTDRGIYVIDTVDGTSTVTSAEAAGLRPAPAVDDGRAPPAPTSGTDGITSASPLYPELKAAEAAPTPQTTIDILVAYSHAMVTRAGSVAGARLRIDQLVALTNQAYVDSEVAITLRLAHAVEVAYSETADNDVALNDLTAGAGVLAAPATTLRNRYGADLVVLLRPFNYPSQSGCGIAWIGGYNGAGGSIGSQPNSGFAVVSDGGDVNGTGYYCFNVSFAHELGHNMGAMHDRGTVTQGGTTALQTGAYSYSYGYVHNATWTAAYGVNVCNAGAGTSCFGTIMSYMNSTPEPRFSNPLIATCSQSQVCGTSSDNVALTLNNTRQGVATWKETKVPFVGTTTGSGQSATINSPFAVQLQVVLRDATGQLVPGVDVVFAAPTTGASASLSAQTVTTDANGAAKVTATANGVAGSYTVTATATSGLVPAPFSFALSNGSSTNMLTVQVVGPGTVSGTGINCPSTCTSLTEQGSTVTLTASASANNTFMGWLGACTGTGTCTVDANTPKTVSATFASSSLLPVRVDVDGSAKYDALTDGQLIVRFLRGMSGGALTAGIVGPGASRTDPTTIATYLQNILPRLDIDGNGIVDAATDGTLIMRYLMGFRGSALIANALGTGATRTTAAAIEQAAAALVP